MLAVAVAVRVDVYGVFYALILGILMLAQGVSMALRHRSIVVPHPLQCVLYVCWCSYLLVHGVLLGAQYVFLLGVPRGTCASSSIDEGEEDFIINPLETHFLTPCRLPMEQHDHSPKEMAVSH